MTNRIQPSSGHRKRRGKGKGAAVVGVLGGSKSDFPILEKAVAVLTVIRLWQLDAEPAPRARVPSRLG